MNQAGADPLPSQELSSRPKMSDFAYTTQAQRSTRFGRYGLVRILRNERPCRCRLANRGHLLAEKAIRRREALEVGIKRLKRFVEQQK